MRIKNTLAVFAAVAFSTSIALAQPPQGGPPGGPGGRGGPQGGGPPQGGNPIMEVLDTDNNFELSASEIENASKALKSLDKNGDGKIQF